MEKERLALIKFENMKDFNKTQKIMNQISEFEKNIWQKESSNDRVVDPQKNEILQNIFKKIKKSSQIVNILENLKRRENSYQTDHFKKERDRRLRKMIVDLKKDRLYNTFNEMKKIILKSIMQLSSQERKLFTTFHQIEKHKLIFFENQLLH